MNDNNTALPRGNFDVPAREGKKTDQQTQPKVRPSRNLNTNAKPSASLSLDGVADWTCRIWRVSNSCIVGFGLEIMVLVNICYRYYFPYYRAEKHWIITTHSNTQLHLAVSLKEEFLQVVERIRPLFKINIGKFTSIYSRFLNYEMPLLPLSYPPAVHLHGTWVQPDRFYSNFIFENFSKIFRVNLSLLNPYHYTGTVHDELFVYLWWYIGALLS